MSLSLDTTEANPSISWTIDSLSGDALIVERLREVGLFPGAEISIIRRMPLGGPVVVRTGDVDLALRSQEAQCIWIQRQKVPQ